MDIGENIKNYRQLRSSDPAGARRSGRGFQGLSVGDRERQQQAARGGDPVEDRRRPRGDDRRSHGQGAHGERRDLDSAGGERGIARLHQRAQAARHAPGAGGDRVAVRGSAERRDGRPPRSSGPWSTGYSRRPPAAAMAETPARSTALGGGPRGPRGGNRRRSGRPSTWSAPGARAALSEAEDLLRRVDPDWSPPPLRPRCWLPRPSGSAASGWKRHPLLPDRPCSAGTRTGRRSSTGTAPARAPVSTSSTKSPTPCFRISGRIPC